MPSLRRIGVPGRKRDCGVTRSRSWPNADQSRWASSISLSDLLTQTARRRPPIVEQYPCDLAALARPRAVAQKPAASKADGVRGIISGGGQVVVGFVDGPRALEMRAMSLAGIDDAFQLGVR